MKKAFALLISLLLLLATATADDGGTIFEFKRLSAVAAPFTGAANPINGIPGAGADWKIARGRAELKANGEIEVRVRGLVLVRNNTNPVAQFQVVLSCSTADPANPGKTRIVNVSLPPAPATATGDFDQEGVVTPPSPCNAPIVFVVIPGANQRWLAVSGF